jgi:hypothetical protein
LGLAGLKEGAVVVVEEQPLQKKKKKKTSNGMGDETKQRSW